MDLNASGYNFRPTVALFGSSNALLKPRVKKNQEAQRTGDLDAGFVPNFDADSSSVCP